ncbi:hypothetical protein NE471_27895, partial [Escherichia coli]|uniref:hypothetical protein n=1 Tax=Escherichia coli TaxID=562 RepID=UPI00210A4692
GRDSKGHTPAGGENLLTPAASGESLNFQQDLLNLSKRAWLARKPISQGGLLKYVHGGEYHAYNPDVVRTLQQAVQSGEYSDYQEYAKLVNERPATTLR